jgi:hypothetical protein
LNIPGLFIVSEDDNHSIAEKTGLQLTQIYLLALLLTGFVTLGKMPDISELELSHLYTGLTVLNLQGSCGGRVS